MQETRITELFELLENEVFHEYWNIAATDEARSAASNIFSDRHIAWSKEENRCLGVSNGASADAVISN